MTGNFDLDQVCDVHRSRDGTYRIRYDPAEHPEVSTLVCTVVAMIADVDTMNLEPLHQTIDPDALNSLFHFSKPGYSGNNGFAAFTFAGYDVRVFADGTIEIAPIS